MDNKSFYWKRNGLGFSYKGNILSAVLTDNKFLKDYLQRDMQDHLWYVMHHCSFYDPVCITTKKIL